MLKLPTIRTLIIGIVVFVAGAIVVGAAGIAGWEYSNRDAFCANTCHGVHPEEPYAHQLGHHASVACVECHIGRVSTFAAIAEKTGHITHAWSFLAGFERPTTAPSFKGSVNSCEGCHTSAPHSHNTVLNEQRFSSDRRNTESKLTLTMRLRDREFSDEQRRGVNWHSSGAVRFISDDPQNLNIRWVEATLPDGSTHVYNDVRNPLSEDELKQSSAKIMDCSDCHNRAGHPFRSPEEEVDAALREGRLDPDLPFIKQRMIDLLNQDFESSEEAATLVHDAWESYRAEFPDIEERNPDAWTSARAFMEERSEFLVDLLVRRHFVDHDVSWRSFPDHNGHKQDPGCFRCHNGRLQTSDGMPITSNCTNCHSIPLITRRNRVPDYFLAIIDVEKPDSHEDPAFISRHMTLMSEECTICHEEMRFGANDRSYCANSGCHGEIWQYLDLDALRSRN